METEASSPDVDSSPAYRPKSTTILIGFSVLCLIWGSTWIVIKEGLQDLPPLTSLGVRFASAAILMMGTAPLIHRFEGGTKPAFWLSLVLGVTNFAFPFSVVYYAETILPSGLVSLLWATFPIMLATMTHFLIADERLEAKAIIGLLMGMGGVAVLVSGDVRELGVGAVGAALWLLLSPLSAAVGNALIKKHGERVSSAYLNRNGMIIGASCVVLAALVVDRDAEITWTRSAVFSIVYLSLIGTVVTFSLYFWLMRYTRARTMSLITYVTPVVALFLGWWFHGEPVGALTLVGAFLIFSSVALVMGAKSRSRQEAPAD